MPKIKLIYDISSDTFVASDEKNNHVSLKGGHGHEASPDLTSESASVSPMQSLIMSLGACSGIDVVSILHKKRQSFTQFEIEIDAEREADVVPSLWVSAHATYIFSNEVDLNKAQQAVQLSVDKYCSVAETLRRAGCKITYELKHI